MARISVSLEADVVIEVMLRSGIRNAQDAVEVVLRDYLATRTRTGAIVGDPDEDGRAERQGPPNPYRS